MLLPLNFKFMIIFFFLSFFCCVSPGYKKYQSEIKNMALYWDF